MKTTQKTSKPSLRDLVNDEPAIRFGPLGAIDRLPAPIREELVLIAKEWKTGELNRSCEAILRSFMKYCASHGIEFKMEGAQFNKELRRLSGCR